MERAHLGLLGGFSLHGPGGTACALQSAKARGLIALIALGPGRSITPERAVARLWSDRSDTQARDSLKHAVADLRAALGVAGITGFDFGRQALRLDPEMIEVDVLEFLAEVQSSDPETVGRGLARFRGDLLEGVTIRDPAFEDWLRDERQGLRTIAETAAARLLADAETSGGADERDVAARRLLGLDPLREDAVRALMAVHAERGERSAALRLFEALRQRLRQEIQSAPDPATQALERHIRDGAAAHRTQGTDLSPALPLTLPTKPSIVVLPFDRHGGDALPDYLVDGIVEDITNALSRYRWFFVINRNSGFAYRDRPVPLREIGRELGVRYVLSGSLRSSGQRVRLTAALIEAETGVQLWGQGFDRDMTDIFALQDDLTRQVVGAIEPEMLIGESRRALDRSAGRLAAYDCHMRGMWFHNRQQGALDFAEAIRWQRRAIALDPTLARAYMVLARALYARCLFGHSPDIAADRADLAEAARKAVTLEDGDGYSHYAMSLAHLLDNRPAEALAEAEHACDLNPSLALAQNALGWTRIVNGQFAAALAPVESAIRLSPRDPLTYLFLSRIGLAHYHLGDYRQALHHSRRALALRRQGFILSVALASMGQLGMEAEAPALRDELLALMPEDAAAHWAMLLVYANPADQAHFLQGLHRAGLDLRPEADPH